jgi:hypothetical protein
METDFLEAAYRLRELANKALEADKTGEWLSLMEMAFTSAAASGATVPISIKLSARSLLPAPVAAIEHLIAQISRSGVVVHIAIDLLPKPFSDFRRFPLVGALLSQVAGELAEGDSLQGILDISDGTDAGNYPRLAFSSARSDTVLIPDPYLYFNDNNSVYRAYAERSVKKWVERRDIVFWRGGSGGPRLCSPDPQNPRDWSCQQRLRLCQAARDSRYGARLDIALSHANTIAEAYLRESLAKEGFLKPEVPKLEFFEYRYLIDVDGWTNAWSLLDKLIGAAVLLKVDSAFGYRQWFYDRLIPWENYIPLAADLSDFDDIIDWVFAHPQACEAIAGNAARVAEQTQLLPDLAFAAKAAMAILVPLPRS